MLVDFVSANFCAPLDHDAIKRDRITSLCLMNPPHRLGKPVTELLIDVFVSEVSTAYGHRPENKTWNWHRIGTGAHFGTGTGTSA
jgi:hypothetical protein